MKKLNLLFFIAIFLSSCNCMLSQMPPQKIYSDKNCKALLPDYKKNVTVTGGCTGYSLTQSPVAGTVITSYTPQMITLKVTSVANRSSSMSFTVTMIDTITPQLVVSDSGLVYHTIDHKQYYFKKLASSDSLHITYQYDPTK